MPAKYNGRYFFTDLQLPKFNHTTRRLCNLADDASCELREVGRSNLTNKRYQDANDFFADVAAQMTSVLQFRVEILRSAQQPTVTLVQFVFAPVCGECMASPNEREDLPGVEAPLLDPAHYAEFEKLLEFVNDTREQLWSSRKRRKTLPAAPTTGLKRLANVLVKLLRHFREMAPVMPPRMESHTYVGDDCSRCHRPLTIPAKDSPLE